MTVATSSSSNKPSAAEIAKQLKNLLKPLKDERADAARLDELRRLFATQDLSPSSSSEAVKKWKTHLSKQLSVFVSQLTNRMHRKTTVRTFWGVLAAMPAYSPINQHPYCSQGLIQKFLGNIPATIIESDKVFRTMVESEFLHQYRDVQYYAYIALAQLAEEQYSRHNSKNEAQEQEAGELLFQILTMLPRVKSQADLDEGTYLFPPPTAGKVEEEDSDDDDDEDEEEDDDSDSEGEDESDSDEEEENPPKKRRIAAVRRAVPKVFHYQQFKGHRKVMARAWLGILKLRLPTSALKRALQILPTEVLPHVSNPLRFADFFVQAYGTHSAGAGTSVVPILALDGLFYLLMEHNLEYPMFYTSLYRLISPTLFHVKYRIRFFQLLIKSLTRNEMLPAHVVAAFLKRLLRSSLQAPPSGCLFALALSSNLLRKHEECASLIHKTAAIGGIDDKFNADTDDPTKAQALESSLWELTVLEKHYYPAVATMALSLGTMETSQIPMHNMEDFLVHTYKSLFDQERKRLDKKRKKIPLAFVKPTALFVERDVFSGMLQVSAGESN